LTAPDGTTVKPGEKKSITYPCGKFSFKAQFKPDQTLNISESLLVSKMLPKGVSEPVIDFPKDVDVNTSCCVQYNAYYGNQGCNGGFCHN